MNGRTDRRMLARSDGRTDGWIDGWMNGISLPCHVLSDGISVLL